MKDRRFVNPVHLLEEIAKSLPTEMMLILREVGEGEHVIPLGTVADYINMPPELVFKNARIMRKNGLLTLTVLHRQDSDLVCGSGYYRSCLGDEVLQYIESITPNVQPTSGPH